MLSWVMALEYVGGPVRINIHWWFLYIWTLLHVKVSLFMLKGVLRTMLPVDNLHRDCTRIPPVLGSWVSLNNVAIYDHARDTAGMQEAVYKDCIQNYEKYLQIRYAIYCEPLRLFFMFTCNFLK